MSEFVHIARQPIIDANNDIFGYEILHRNESGAVDQSLTDRTLSAKVILSVYNLIGRERALDGDKMAFFNIDSAFILTDIIEVIPSDQCIFEISSSSIFHEKERVKIKYLYEKGYRFALDNFSVSETSFRDFDKILPYISYLKVDVQNSDNEYVATQCKKMQRRHTLIAQKVESLQEFSAYRDMGFTYFQGFFIQHPQPVKHYRLEPRHFGVTRLYKMLRSEEFPKFSREFERHNELSIQLFQFFTSTGKNRFDATRSVREVVRSYGPDKMEKWMMLIVYAKGSSHSEENKSAFSRFFERRIDMMHAIVTNIHTPNPQQRHDELRLLAIFSTLVDVYQVPFDSLLNSFIVSNNIQSWLISRKGRFSLIYKAVNLVENPPYEDEKADRILKAFKTDIDTIRASLKHKI